MVIALSTLAYLLFVGVLVYYVIVTVFYPSKEPPGPWGLPIVGYLPFLGKKANITLTKLWEKYGDVYQIRIGGRKTVVICGQRAIREACASRANELAGRPDYHTYKAGFRAFGAPGYTATFRLYKKLTLKAIGLFAHARRSELEDVAYRAVEMLMDDFKKANGEPIDPKFILSKAIWTIMGYFSYGRFFNKDDPEVDRAFANLDSFAKTMMFGVIVDYFPWAKFLLKNQLERFDTLMSTLDKYSSELSQKNIETYIPGYQRNISDVFVKASEEMTSEEKRLLNVNDETLRGVVSGLFGAGFGTIAATTQWSLLFMAKYPEYQKAVQDELDRVVGQDRHVSFSDMESLPLTVATINEVYRASSMSALGITHAAVTDTEFKGYSIAAGTPIVFNLFSAHRDPVYFPDAETFRPNRFLNPDGSLNKAAIESVMPFGLGPRRCGGEQIARAEVFLFFSTILQKCSIIPDHVSPPDPSNYFCGLGLTPLPFKVIFNSRTGEW